MRPLYETKENLGKEAEVVQVIEALMNCTLHKLPISYRMDYGMFRNDDMKGLIEIKCRTHSFDKYPSVILSSGKWMEACRWIDKGFPCHFVVGFVDGVYIHNLRTFGYPVVIAGRKDRNDEADIEPCIDISANLWSKLI